jgi:hypothetical protein
MVHLINNLTTIEFNSHINPELIAYYLEFSIRQKLQQNSRASVLQFALCSKKRTNFRS